MNVFLRAFRPSPTQRRISEEHYELIQSEPTRPQIHIRHHYPHQNQNHNHNHRRRLLFLLLNCHKSCSLRRVLISFTALPFLLLIAILFSGIPPSYHDIRSFERRLPQHNLTLPFPEGSDGMYLRFPGHLWGHGLNNILQETILMSYLAYMSNRSFVFEDYTWSHTPFPYTVYDFALRPKRIPLNAFISGPTAGGPMPSSHSNSPRAISAEWWETVCPARKRHVVSSKDAPSDVEGDVLIDWWVRRLERVKEGCVEIDSSSRDVFDKFLFGSSRILSLWPSLSASPILSSFTWSPLVQSAVARNFALLNLQPLTLKKTLFDDTSSTATLTGLVAVHLRRGDYKRHCPRLATWGSEFMGLNQFSELPDKFDPDLYSSSSPSSSPTTPSEEEEESSSSSPPTRESHYLLHCLPTIPQIVTKLHLLRATHPTPLHRLYVLSNGWSWWLDELKQALKKDGWGEMVSSADVEKRLDAEQKWVGMAVDMAVAEKAEVFLGNGFSSLTSNVVMLRMAKGLNPSTSRFL